MGTIARKQRFSGIYGPLGVVSPTGVVNQTSLRNPIADRAYSWLLQRL